MEKENNTDPVLRFQACASGCSVSVRAHGGSEQLEPREMGRRDQDQKKAQ